MAAHIEVKMISKEIIKPSSPTPSHLRRYQYSFLDQTTSPKMYTSLLLFYESKGEKQPNITAEISNHLKKSLAKVLTLYYPLAGRARDNLYIDCNDEGVLYLEAQVINNRKLSDVLRNPVTEELTKLLPFKVDDGGNNDVDVPFGVQLNVFGCGGFAIGQCVSHKIADGLSSLMFSKAWAATARRAVAQVHRPEFVSATLFPPKQSAEASLGFAKDGMLVTKKFVFDAPNIEHLRAKYVGLEQIPTRVETLTAFIWSRLAAKVDRPKLHKVSLAVNLRPRFDPALTPQTYGNIISLANSTPSLLNTWEVCHGLAKQIRRSIRKIDKGYIQKLQEGLDVDQGSSEGNNDQAGSNEFEGRLISVFTSLCNYPLYDNDFGWGKPSWASFSFPQLDLDNVVIFTDTRDGNGIEASITTAVEVMTRLESDTEFLQQARPIGSLLA